MYFSTEFKDCSHPSEFNGTLFPKLFWPTVRKKMFYWSRKTFEIWGREFSKFSRSLEQFIQTVKGQENFGNRMLLYLGSWTVLRSNKWEQLEFELKKIVRIKKHAGKVIKKWLLPKQTLHLKGPILNSHSTLCSDPDFKRTRGPRSIWISHLNSWARAYKSQCTILPIFDAFFCVSSPLLKHVLFEWTWIHVILLFC